MTQCLKRFVAPLEHFESQKLYHFEDLKSVGLFLFILLHTEQKYDTKTQRLIENLTTNEEFRKKTISIIFTCIFVY